MNNLKAALKAGYQEEVVIFRVNSSGRKFLSDDRRNENNHFLGLYFKGGEIHYIDLTDKPISESVKQAIKSHHSLNNEEIKKESYVMGGNDTDCGVLLTLVDDMIKQNYQEKDQIKLNENSSKDLGQILRRVINNEQSLNNSGRAIDNILKGDGVEQLIIEDVKDKDKSYGQFIEGSYSCYFLI